MSCCGQGRKALASVRHTAGVAPPTTRRTGQPGIVFEYTGQESATVVGGVTGARYEFRGYGACVRVDIRDRSQMLRVPGLRMVG